MSLFDILGPVMVGPSSSHTAGAARIGYICYKLMDEPIERAEIGLYGSFLATGKGHGTDRALIAGLLGMKPADERIPESFEYSKVKFNWKKWKKTGSNSRIHWGWKSANSTDRWIGSKFLW